MELSEFKIGDPFWTGSGKWICTDIGTRTVIAAKYDEMMNYHHKVHLDPVLCNEQVFHRYDWDGCWLTEKEYKEMMNIA